MSTTNCMVIYPPDKGGVKFENRPDARGMKRYIKWRKQYMYVMTCEYDSDGKAAYRPFVIEQSDRLPSELLDALDWRTLKREFAFRASMLQQLNLWAGVALAGIIVFLMFIILGEMGVV